MKTVNILRALSLMSVVLSLVLFNSCQEEEGDRTVELLSFGPSGVHHGDEIVFIGRNLDQVSAIVLQPNVEVTSFTEKTASRIKLIVPAEAEAGKVMLKHSGGEIESKTILNFDVPVEIESITEEAKPGTTITITGDKVNWIETITFADDIVVEKADFVSLTLSQLVVTVPMEAQTGFLIFATGGTTPLTFGSEEQLIVTLPTITTLQPTAVKHTDELTITGTNLDLVNAVEFGGGRQVLKENFVNQTATEIKLIVPATAVKGKVVLKQTSPVVVESSTELIVILPTATTATPSPVVPGSGNLTITGTNLDLVAEIGLPSAPAILAATFVSHTPTQIVLTVPEATKSGGITYKTIHGYSGSLGVTVRIPAPGPAPLPITLYDETVASGGGDWSWGGTSVPASAEQFFSGEVSWKFTATGGGGLSAGGIAATDVSGQQAFIFSLYGGPGTNGLQVAAILNDNWANYNAVTLQEGKWTEYQIPLSQYPAINLTQIVRFTFKPEGGSTPVIYADRVGFGAAGPPPLDYYLFDDALKNDWQQWDGWGLTSKDFANEEEVFKGTKAIKAVYNDQYGAIQIGRGTAIDITGYTTLTFRVYASAAQQLIVQLNNDSDNYLNIPQGWSEVSLPVATMNGNKSAVSEFRIKNNNASLPVTLFFDEIGLKN
ncbi:MAG: IPT/TIG domain-containing protein [Cytophagales bacterium]|nr:IPT/TIG domain-containing protein [Cytophagales bacterium]